MSDKKLSIADELKNHFNYKNHAERELNILFPEPDEVRRNEITNIIRIMAIAAAKKKSKPPVDDDEDDDEPPVKPKKKPVVDDGELPKPKNVSKKQALVEDWDDED